MTAQPSQLLPDPKRFERAVKFLARNRQTSEGIVLTADVLGAPVVSGLQTDGLAVLPSGFIYEIMQKSGPIIATNRPKQVDDFQAIVLFDTEEEAAKFKDGLYIVTTETVPLRHMMATAMHHHVGLYLHSDEKAMLIDPKSIVASLHATARELGFIR